MVPRRTLCVWFLLSLCLGAALCKEAGRHTPSSFRLPLYRNFYVSVLIGNEGKEQRLRIRFDEDRIVVYGTPSSSSYDVVTGLAYVSLGPLVANLTLPLFYTWPGDPRVSDPVSTNQRVSYAGVLGLGPGSSLWNHYHFDSWRLERDWLVIGEPAPKNTLALPPVVSVDPRNDFTSITDMKTYLRWLATLPNYRKAFDDSSEDFAALGPEADGTASPPPSPPPPLPAEDARHAELAKCIRVYSRTSRSGGEWFSRADYSTVDTAMVIDAQNSDSDRIEVDAYTVDSASGYYLELVRFEPRMPAVSNATLAARKRWQSVQEYPVVILGLLHASDYVLYGSADLGTVLLSPSPSGPFRPQPSAFVWMFVACFVLAFLHVPGLWERFQRARRLFMPTRQGDYLRELAKVHEDWTYLLLVCRFVLFAAFWVMHMSLASYRSVKSFNPRGWYVAYYVPVAYILANVVFGAVRYPDRHSTVRYSIAMQLACVLLLSNGYEFVISMLLMLMLAFNALRVASDRLLSSLIRPDGDLDRYQQLRLLALAAAEAAWLAWFAAFYVLDHALVQLQHNLGMNAFLELIVLVLFLGLCSVTVCLQEEVVRIRPNVALLATLTNERLTAQLAARKKALDELAAGGRSDGKSEQVAPSTTKGAPVVPRSQPSASSAPGVIVPQHFHFGLGLKPIDAAMVIHAGQTL